MQQGVPVKFYLVIW